MIISKYISHNLAKSKYLEFLPKFKEEKTQKFTTLVFTLLAFSFFGFFAINPTLSTIAALKKELSDNEFVNQKLDEKISNLSILNQKYDLLREDLSSITSIMPPNPNPTLLAGQIQAIAAENNVKLSSLQIFEIEISKNIRPDSTEDPKSYSKFIFSFGAKGSYTDLKKFLASFTDFQRIITIESISVRGANNSTMEIDIKASSYFKK